MFIFGASLELWFVQLLFSSHMCGCFFIKNFSMYTEAITSSLASKKISFSLLILLLCFNNNTSTLNQAELAYHKFCAQIFTRTKCVEFRSTAMLLSHARNVASQLSERKEAAREICLRNIDGGNSRRLKATWSTVAKTLLPFRGILRKSKVLCMSLSLALIIEDWERIFLERKTGKDLVSVFSVLCRWKKANLSGEQFSFQIQVKESKVSTWFNFKLSLFNLALPSTLRD